VEVIVVLAIFSIVSIAISESATSFYRFNAYTIAQTYEVSDARKGMELLVRDMREMTFADDGTFPLARMEDDLIGFYSDIDRDDSVEYVEYEVATTTLFKRVYNATGSPPTYNTTVPDSTLTISEYIQNNLQSTTTFVYYDGEGFPATPTSTVTDIKYIQAKIIVNIDPLKNPGQFMLRSSAALRNLKNTQ